jgi:cobalt-precorrin 5A hydrolase/precorrin-3B C17-methyltransferase
VSGSAAAAAARPNGEAGAGAIVALGFSPVAVPLLRRLEQTGLVAEIRWPAKGDGGSGDDRGRGAEAAEEEAIEPAAAWLAGRWGRCRAILAVAACGLVTRLIAPLLNGKDRDPAVLALDPEGRWVVPLLGGHHAGADRLAGEIAALLEGEAVLTGASTSRGRLPLDAFGSAWGWRRGQGDWTALMVAAGRDRGPAVIQEGGLELWRDLEAARTCLRPQPEEPGAASLVVGPRTGAGCRWHPPCLWLGVGCERGTSLGLLERLVDRTLARHDLAPEAVAALASISRKGDEAALLELAARRGWPLRLFTPEQLAAVPVPNPSAVVARAMGTASVAEAAALAGATAAAMAVGEAASGGPAAAVRLLVEKTIGRADPGERGAATLAVAFTPRQWAPGRGALHLVGSGPGRLDLLTAEARRALAAASVWVGYGLYLDLLEPLRGPQQLRRDGRLTEERARCAEALDLARGGLTVALVSSGDSGIYGMAGLALELWLSLPPPERPAFTVHPGLSALQLAAARAGAPLMHDFCTVSLSDRLTPWEVIERRLRAAAAGDFVVALYNPRSRGRDWQLERARRLLLEARRPDTPVVLARQLGRPGEEVRLSTLAELPVARVDMLTVLLVGNSTSFAREGRMVTPRGYPGAELA